MTCFQYAFLVTLLCALGAAQAGSAEAPKDQLQRDRYLIQTAGCSDCHTPGYGPKEGKVDEKLWLTGDSLGFAGAWGTTYPTNLSRLLDNMSEQQWENHARAMRPRPLMPSMSVRAMTVRT